MSKWTDKASFISPRFEEHAIDGVTLRFYPVSVGLAFKLRDLAKPVAAAMAVLFADEKRDQGTVNRTIPSEFKNADGSVAMGSEFIMEPSAPSVIEKRTDRRSKAVADAIDALTCDSSRLLLGEIIMDSLRDEFPRGSKDNPPVAEFMSQLSCTALPQLLLGVVKANKEVLGPLGEAAASAWGQFGSLLKAKSEELTRRVSEELEVVPGSTSKTKSSGSSNVAMDDVL